MPEVRRNAGRRSTACKRCHKQKVKCSRDKPCRNCQSAKVDCLYPENGRFLMVPETYLRDLEAYRNRARHLPTSPQSSSNPPEDQDAGIATNDDHTRRSSQHIVENSAAELFVAKVKQLRQDAPFFGTSNPSLDEDGEHNEGSRFGAVPASGYEYFRLSYDTSHPNISLNLPPYPYAHHLFNLVEIYIGYDYHWLQWRSFKERMETTYKNPGSAESRDRFWLCRLLIVFALGETFANYYAPVIHLGTTLSPEHDKSTEATGFPTAALPPGAAFFEQALVLLKLPYEEPSIDHIETLNLATFYSYSLNRKNTAYMYAGTSARMCSLLRLHQPAPQGSLSPSEQEHRKRLFWTTYCLDKMTSSELGALPSFQVGQIKVDFPNNDILTQGDTGQFQPAEFLKARIRLTFLKAEADVFIDLWQSIRDDIPDVERRVRPILLKLRSWLEDLPPFMSFNCDSGIPERMAELPTMRSLASLYLRCHQCFILLLRPLFLKQITYIVSDEPHTAPEDNLKTFGDTCVRAARTNLCILIGLKNRDRVAHFGFWDSLHLFSSLTILCLAMSANKRRAGSFDEKENDCVTYGAAKDILRDMIHAGNVASKGHEKMLLEVETLGELLGAVQEEGSEIPMEQWDMDIWMAQVLSIDPTSMMFNVLE